MVVKVLGSPISTCTQRILITLAELGVEGELVPIDLMTGEHKQPDFLKKQPFGKVPVMEDGDVTIFESRTILRYLAKNYTDKVNLSGATPKEAALVDNWLEAEAQNYNPPVSGVVSEKIFKPLFGGATDDAAVDAYLATLDGVLSAYEAVLGDGRPFIAGENFSIADISHIPYGVLFADKAGGAPVFEKYPLFKAWWDKITSRESVKKVLG